MQKQCIFCDNSKAFPRLLNLALYSRYQSDYCPLPLGSAQMLHFQDDVCFEDDEEYLKSYYQFPYLKAKKKQLIEYYRYHQDIPRFFIDKVTPMLETYHEKQRELRYRKIKYSLGIADEERKETKTYYSFKALLGLTEIETSRLLVEMMNQLKFPQAPQFKFDINSLANLITEQKRQMQQLIKDQKVKRKIQPKNQLTKLLGTGVTTSTHCIGRTCHTLMDYKQKTNKNNTGPQHMMTESAPSPKFTDFQRKWSNLISHRELQYQKMKMKSSLLTKKKSLK